MDPVEGGGVKMTDKSRGFLHQHMYITIEVLERNLIFRDSSPTAVPPPPFSRIFILPHAFPESICYMLPHFFVLHLFSSHRIRAVSARSFSNRVIFNSFLPSPQKRLILRSVSYPPPSPRVEFPPSLTTICTIWGLLQKRGKRINGQ